jgi:hypothetical protein
VCSLVILSKLYSTKSKALLAESIEQHLLIIFTPLSLFYVTLHRCSLLDNTGASYCPEKLHDKGTVLYKHPTNSCKNNLQRSTDPMQLYLAFIYNNRLTTVLQNTHHEFKPLQAIHTELLNHADKLLFSNENEKLAGIEKSNVYVMKYLKNLIQ